MESSRRGPRPYVSAIPQNLDGDKERESAAAWLLRVKRSRDYRHVRARIAYLAQSLAEQDRIALLVARIARGK